MKEQSNTNPNKELDLELERALLGTQIEADIKSKQVIVNEDKELQLPEQKEAYFSVTGINLGDIEAATAYRRAIIAKIIDKSNLDCDWNDLDKLRFDTEWRKTAQNSLSQGKTKEEPMCLMDLMEIPSEQWKTELLYVQAAEWIDEHLKKVREDYCNSFPIASKKLVENTPYWILGAKGPKHLVERELAQKNLISMLQSGNLLGLNSLDECRLLKVARMSHKLTCLKYNGLQKCFSVGTRGFPWNILYTKYATPPVQLSKNHPICEDLDYTDDEHEKQVYELGSWDIPIKTAQQSKDEGKGPVFTVFSVWRDSTPPSVGKAPVVPAKDDKIISWLSIWTKDSLLKWAKKNEFSYKCPYSIYCRDVLTKVTGSEFYKIHELKELYSSMNAGKILTRSKTTILNDFLQYVDWQSNGHPKEEVWSYKKGPVLRN